MDPRLSQLLELQETLSEQREIENEYQLIPQRQDEINAILNGIEQQIEAARAKILECETEQKTRELDLQSNQDKRLKKEAQVLTIKNKKEYDASMSEIDTLDKKNQRIEARLMELMEEIEKNKKIIEEKESELEAKRNQYSGELDHLAKRADEMGAALNGAKSVSDGVIQKVNPNLYQRFARVFSMRGGLAVAPANSGHCGGCNIKLTPRLMQLVKRGQDIVQCESCHRFLYWENETLAEDDDIL
ncbi:MAG: hypothetical protein GC154_02555 [bacterium]|nr:hypothetical protein [bacterium]